MMSSSDGRGVAGKAAVAVDPRISAAAKSKTRRTAGDGSAATSAEVGKLAPASSEPDKLAAASPDAGRRGPGDPQRDDPWFGATPGRANEPRPAAFDPDETLVDWFLPGGRAALLPESMTVSSDEGESGNGQRLAPAATGVPPWAAEAAASAAGEPPPWENGPWPGPGGVLPSRSHVAPRSRQSAARQDEPASLWTPRTVLIAGLLPLVVPGLVIGLMGLRRTSSGEPGRRASILALAASLAWAVVIVVVVALSTGGSSGECSYPAAVHQAYATAMAEIKGSAPAATEATDLGLAASRANSAAAAAGEIPVRTALFDMAGDLQQARTDVIAKRPVPASLRTQLTADGAALTASCPA